MHFRSRFKAAFACCLLAASARPGLAQSDSFQPYSADGSTVQAFASQLQSLVQESDQTAEIVPDPSKNRVLVRGSDATHRIAQSLQRTRKSGFQPTDGVELQSYKPGPGVDARQLAESLKARFAKDSTVQIAFDPRTGKILVNANAANHQIINTAVVNAALNQPPNRKDRPARLKQPNVVQAPTQGRSTGRATSAETQLKNITWQQLVAAMQGMSTSRLALQQVDGNELIVDVPATKGNARFKINPTTGVVGIAGPAPVVKSWVDAIRTLDKPAVKSQDTEMVALNHAAPANVTRAVYLLQGQGEAAADQAANEAANAGDQDVAELAGGLIGNVEIGFVEGLDALIIRGSDADVAKIKKIIAALEEASVETAPVIKIVELKHVSSEAMADLVNELNTEPLAPRQGSVSITALVKPNALLLIGRPAAVQASIDLINRLDQEVEPQSQFQIFQLSDIPAQTASDMITNFFAERAGLGTRVLVQPDFRSNAVVVYASPRDMAEVALLIKKIDTKESKSVAEVRVFQLSNASAAELANLLNSIMVTNASGAGGTTSGTGGQGGQQTPGAPPTAAQLGIGTPGGTSGGTGGGGGSRSSMLTFKRFDQRTREILKSGILTDVQVNADTRTNSLVVKAPAESMGLIAALIKELDQLPESEAQIDVFTIENGSVNSVYTMLQTLFGSSQTGATQQGGFQGGAFSTGSGDNALVPLRFSADTDSNSIIVAGSASDLAVVDTILTRLDSVETSDRRSTVYRLLNAPATDVAAAINQLLQSSGQQTTGAYEYTLNPAGLPTVIAEPVSNSLIVSASPKYYDKIAEIVMELDARPPMVYVKVLIAEVALDNTEELGVELGIQDSLLFDRGVFTNNAVTPGYLFNNAPLGNSGSARSLATRENTAGQALSNFGVGRSSSQTGYGGLVLSAGSESINVLVRALQETGRLEVLSAPEIMTLNNQPANILVGSEVPFIGNTTFSANGLAQNSIDRQPVGLQLGVTPRISPDGLVVMEIDAVKSALADAGVVVSVDQFGNAIEQPIVNTTQASTTVSARSGQTIILGGLITKDSTIRTRRVPYLADVPVLGSLFRFDSERVARTELLFIMTPYVVKKEEDTDWINQVESQRMSWCLADVANIYGDRGFASKCEPYGSHYGTMDTPYPGEDVSAMYDGERIYSEELLSDEAISNGGNRTNLNSMPNNQAPTLSDPGSATPQAPLPDSFGPQAKQNPQGPSDAAVRDDLRVATWDSIRERETKLNDAREELTLPAPATSDKPETISKGRFQSAKRFFSKIRGRKSENVDVGNVAPVNFVERVDEKKSKNPLSRAAQLWK